LAAGAAVLALSRRWGARQTATIATLLLIGFLAAPPLLGELGTRGETPGVPAKVIGMTNNDLFPRLDTWRTSVHPMIVRRPLLGYGPGRFAVASSPVRPPSVARWSPDGVFSDAHDLFVEYTVTTGLLGLAALTGWLVLAGRAARGPLLCAGCAILAVYLVEPLFVGTVPVAFLLLGAASPSTATTATAHCRTSTTATVLLGLLAVASGVVLLVGDFEFHQAELDFRTAPARNAVDLLPGWPETAHELGKINDFRAIATHRPELLAQTVLWWTVAANRDASNAVGWNYLGLIQLVRHEDMQAEHAFRRALVDNPWSFLALSGLAQVGIDTGRPELVSFSLRRAGRVVPGITLEQLRRTGVAAGATAASRR
jgi:hypothetical protein